MRLGCRGFKQPAHLACSGLDSALTDSQLCQPSGISIHQNGCPMTDPHPVITNIATAKFWRAKGPSVAWVVLFVAGVLWMLHIGGKWRIVALFLLVPSMTVAVITQVRQTHRCIPSNLGPIYPGPVGGSRVDLVSDSKPDIRVTRNPMAGSSPVSYRSKPTLFTYQF